MSPRAIAAILISGLIAVGVVIFLQTPLPPPALTPTISATKVVPLAPRELAATFVAPTNFLPFGKTNTASAATSENLPAAAKIERLQNMAMNDDAASLDAILGALTDPAPEVRAAAREAAIQFGDPKAAGPLREAAAKVDDLNEKVALLDAAKYLELPSFRSAATTHPPVSDSANQPHP